MATAEITKTEAIIKTCNSCKKIVLTTHFRNRLRERLKCKNVDDSVIIKLLQTCVQLTPTQLKSHFAYAENDGNILAYIPVIAMFFVMRVDGRDLILRTCINEKPSVPKKRTV